MHLYFIHILYMQNQQGSMVGTLDIYEIIFPFIKVYIQNPFWKLFNLVVSVKIWDFI